MSLDALAPDQRAVVQLVLQQDRSYEDLAGLLGITTDAVRERAHKGLERLAPGDAVDAAERAEVSDYLLGQQSVSSRETTRKLLSESTAARTWAAAVAGALAPIARSPLPEIPSGATAAAPAPDPVATEPAPTAEEPVQRARPRRRPDAEAEATEEPVTRARPRPRASEPETVAEKTDTVAATEAALSRGEGDRPRSSMFGGALLIGGILILIVALVVWLASKNDDDEPETASSGTTATETATPAASGTAAPGDFQQIGQLELAATGDSGASGQIAVYANGDQPPKIAFQLVGQDVPASGTDEAYGVWLVGGDKPHFLGYAPKVGEDGKLGVSGPRESDSEQFLQWLTDAKKVVVTKETEQGATSPGETILEGDLAQTGGGDSAATPEPSP